MGCIFTAKYSVLKLVTGRKCLACLIMENALDVLLLMCQMMISCKKLINVHVKNVRIVLPYALLIELKEPRLLFVSCDITIIILLSNYYFVLPAFKDNLLA